MDALLVANYLTKLKEKTGLTFEAIAEKTGLSLSTVKNLFSGKSEDPRLNTVAPVVYVLNGSVDEMYSGKPKETLQEISLNSIKDMYEFQLSEQRKNEETRIANIRADHEQHRNDVITNYERLLTEKENQIKLYKRLSTISFGIACIGFAILIGLLILEVSNPNMGWIQF